MILAEKFGEYSFQLIYHAFNSQPLRDALDHLRHEDDVNGDFQHVLRDERVYNELQAIVAYDAYNGIPRGWTGIYKRPEKGLWRYKDQKSRRPIPPYDMYTSPLPTHIIGVFVQEEYRGLGLGGRLKEQAIKLCVARGIDFSWQDAETREWVECDKIGKFVRRY